MIHVKIRSGDELDNILYARLFGILEIIKCYQVGDNYYMFIDIYNETLCKQEYFEIVAPVSDCDQAKSKTNWKGILEELKNKEN